MDRLSVWYRRGAYVITYGKALYFHGQVTDQNLVLNNNLILQKALQKLLLRGYRWLKLATA